MPVGKRNTDPKTGLTDLQYNFCLEYMKDFNGTQSAIRAGYGGARVDAYAYELLKNPKIKNFIDHLKYEARKKITMTADDIKNRLVEIAEDPTTGKRDKLRALELLGKTCSLYTDKIVHEGLNIVIDKPEIKKD